MNSAEAVVYRCEPFWRQDPVSNRIPHLTGADGGPAARRVLHSAGRLTTKIGPLLSLPLLVLVRSSGFSSFDSYDLAAALPWNVNGALNTLRRSSVVLRQFLSCPHLTRLASMPS